jgi:hypothetical protein
MVKVDLTNEMIDAGRQLLEVLDRHVASPDVRVRGPRAAYRKVEALARKLPRSAELFGPGDLTLLRDNDPLVVALGRAFPKRPRISGIRLTASAVSGTVIDDAYIYRLS